MPPNVKGGKGYRKGKHAGVEEKILDWDESQGQMLGRTLKKLGDRRFKIFCNDTKERICKLAGSLRKSDWVDEGSIVLIGIRELSTATTFKGGEVGDIIGIADPGTYGKLKKVPGVNPLIFMHVENVSEAEIKRKIHAQNAGEDADDDIFENPPDETAKVEEQVIQEEKEIDIDAI
jgi:initiation factor 1A